MKQTTLNTLRVISTLMVYPSDELREHKKDLCEIIREENLISIELQDRLIGLIDELSAGDLLDRQEHYTELFDKGRSLSLLLFEHVHGEGRARGQAMVDLMTIYNEHGFDINANELPDFIPLYLEYLSQRPLEEAKGWLEDISHILALLSARLLERDSTYAVLFESLLEFSGATADLQSLKREVAQEERDDTPEALDKIWEEEAVTFGPNSNIQANGENPFVKPDEEVPVRFVDANNGNRNILPDAVNRD